MIFLFGSNFVTSIIVVTKIVGIIKARNGKMPLSY